VRGNAYVTHIANVGRKGWPPINHYGIIDFKSRSGGSYFGREDRANKSAIGSFGESESSKSAEKKKEEK
jgi:hypothetical protein